MFELILLGIGLVLVIEGLAYVLAPTLIEDLLRALAAMPVQTRRMIGFAALAIGAVLMSWGLSLGV